MILNEVDNQEIEDWTGVLQTTLSGYLKLNIDTIDARDIERSDENQWGKRRYR